MIIFILESKTEANQLTGCPNINLNEKINIGTNDNRLNDTKNSKVGARNAKNDRISIGNNDNRLDNSTNSNVVTIVNIIRSNRMNVGTHDNRLNDIRNSNIVTSENESIQKKTLIFIKTVY